MNINTTVIYEVGGGSIGNNAAAALARHIVNYIKQNPDVLGSVMQEQRKDDNNEPDHKEI